MANHLNIGNGKVNTPKISFLVKLQPSFFLTLSIFFFISLAISKPLFAQKRVKFKEVSAKIQSESITQKEKIQLLLKIEKKDKLYPLAFAHLHKIYLQKSRQISVNTPQDDLLFLMDSSIYFTGKTISTVKKDFYEKNKGDIIGILRLPADFSYSEFVDQIEFELEQQSQSKTLITQLFSNYENAIHFWRKSNDQFQLIREEHPNKNELYFLSDSLYTQTIEALKSDFFDFKNSYSKYENTADSFPYNIEKIIVQYLSIEDYNTDSGETPENLLDTLSVKNYQKWWLDLELTRENQIQEFWKEMNSTNRLLANIIDTLTSDTLELAQNLDSLEIEDKLIKEIAPESISLTLFKYQYKKATLLNLFNKEKVYNSKSEERNNIIKYYYGLKTKVKELEKNFDLLLKSYSDSLKVKEVNPFLQKQYKDKEGFVAFLEKNSSEIEKQNQYCEGKIREQLLKIFLEKKFIPNYAIYKSFEIALFEQSMATILEKNHFLTLKVINLDNNIKYISGYQRGENKIPFVAKASGQKIVWLKLLNIKLNKAEYLYGYASHLTFDGRNLATIVNQESDDSRKKYLIKLNNEGELQPYLVFDKPENLDFIINHPQDSLTVLGYQLQKDKYNVEGFSGNMGVIWKFSLPYQVQFPQTLLHKGNFVFIANVTETQAAIPNSSIDTFDQFSNILVAIINPFGETKFQKVYKSTNSQFFTHTLELENKAILILGFNGSLDLNNFENKPLFTLEFDPEQELTIEGGGLGKR